ncbi:MAG: glycosyltransferase family 4 protein [Chitinophagales bacterium]
MKVAFITRSTLYKVPGGDTEQIIQTAQCLKDLGVRADILLTNEPINYNGYDLLHFSNIIRPSDILYHTHKTNKPFVVSPNFIDYSEYDKQQRKGIAGFIFSLLPANLNEYLKTISRWLLRKDVLKSISFLTKGHKRSIREILRKTSILLPGSKAELSYLKKIYPVERPYFVVPNGVNTNIFVPNGSQKDNDLVICVARIEGIKNQINLIKALNNSAFTLMIIGEAAPNQKRYYQECKEIAAGNIIFTGRLSHEELVKIYKKAKVHVLPSWFETCGLSTLEAAAMGCNVVITDKGYTREYFGNDAFYCEPSDPNSILKAVQEASKTASQKKLQERVLNNYTWNRAAEITLEAYKKIIPG